MFEFMTGCTNRSEPAPQPTTLLACLFLGSGAAALIYELAWFHVLRLVVGSSSISIAALLVSFMGGMGIGSVLLPRVVPSTWHPLRVYAGLEVAIGVIGVALLAVLPLAQSVYLAAVGYGLGGVLLRAVVCVVCLLPPTILMGATLPAVARWTGATRPGVAAAGRLYGVNTIGAVSGVLLASFYLLRVYDTVVATLVAVALNLAVAGVALVLARGWIHETESVRREPSPAPGRPVVLAVIALSGLASLGAEVVWTRQFSLLFGATVYNFSLILAVFLGGLGGGSLIGAWLARRVERPGLALGWIQVALLGALPFSAFMIGYQIPFWELSAKGNGMSFLFDVARCALSIAPATLVWGASVPLALAAANEGDADAGRIVARVTVANTAGALLGTVLFSLVLIPGVGTQVAQQALVLVAAVAAATMLWAERRRQPTPLLSLAPWLLALAVGLSVWLVPGTPRGLIAFGRDIPGWDTIGQYLFVDEGVSASVAVTDSEAGYRQLHISGKVVASTMDLDMRIERMLGHVPALLHGEPRSVLIVGMGAGVTAGSFVRHPEVERIVICEIEPSVITASDQFREANHAVLSDPRTEVIYDDARHFLATTDEQFDVITSDPIHPWVRGAASLYSVEYHELVKERLRPGGVVAQWVPLYETDEVSAKSQIGTFVHSFPDATLWNSDFLDAGYDLVLIGRVGSQRIDGRRIGERLAGDSALRGSLAEVGLGSTIDLLDTYAGRGNDLEPWLRDAPINRDRSLRLQYLAGLALDQQNAYAIYGAIVGYRRYPGDLFDVAPQDEAVLLRRY